MPAHPALTDQELAQVVLYERVEFGGMEEAGEEYELLLAIAEGDRPSPTPGSGDALRGHRHPRGRPRRRADRPIAGPVRADRQTDPVTAPHRHDVLVIGGGPGRRRGRALARPGRARRRGRREEDLPAGEDLRRRAHPAGGHPAPGDGPRGEDRRQPPPLRRPALHRPRHHPRDALAAAPRAPEPRLRRAPARPRHDGGRGGRGPRAPRCSRAPRPCARSSATGCWPAPS